jgi:nephrocystin-3
VDVKKSAVAPSFSSDDDDRVVRVFVSSTFLDMQVERDILVKDVFPALRARLRACGVELFEVDLRWGITARQQERGETLPTLLSEIDRCRPYFICIVGDRYGWIPPENALTDELKASYPVLAGAAGVSVTAIEIMHGLLSDPDSAQHAFYFERDPGWNWKAALKGDERALAAPEGQPAQIKLAQLKRDIRTKTRNVRCYKAPKEIGAAVLETFGAALSARFKTEASDAFGQSDRLQRAYARERRKFHIGAEAYRAALDRWMRTPDAPPQLIVGDSGAGKSTLIANWSFDWRKARPNDIVLEYYVGATADGVSPVPLMRWLWEYLNRWTGDAVPTPGGELDLMELSASLAQRLARAQAGVARRGGQILIVLDGLDKLVSGKDLRWLPHTPGLKILASSLDGHSKSAALARGWKTLAVEPLTRAERSAFVEQTLASWGRQLLPEHVETILAHAHAGNPLFLKTVLGELRVSATHVLLEERLNLYTAATTLPDLFAKVLERLEADCEPGLVHKTLPLIWASRAGLEEAELVAIAVASRIAWATLRNGVDEGLREQAGRLAFSHDYFSQAIEKRYLALPESKRAFHLAIANHFAKRPADERQAEELPHQLRAAQAWDQLEKVLLDLDAFAPLRSHGDDELLGYWLPLKARGRDPGALLGDAVRARIRRLKRWSVTEAERVDHVREFLSFAGSYPKIVLELDESLAGAYSRLHGADNAATLEHKHRHALALEAYGARDSALKLLEEVVAARARTLGEEHHDTLKSKTALAAALSLPMRQDRALEFQFPSLIAAMCGFAADRTAQTREATQARKQHRTNLARAYELQSSVTTTLTRKLGPDHPETVASLTLIAQILVAQNDPLLSNDRADAAAPTRSKEDLTPNQYANPQKPHVGEAQRLLQRVADGCVRDLGPDHLDSLAATSELAMALVRDHWATDGWAADNAAVASRARGMQERVVAILTSMLGLDHPKTMASIDRLAEILWWGRALLGARSALETNVANRTRLQGDEHLDTLYSRAWLARALDKEAEAEPDYWASTRIRERAKALEEEIEALAARHIAKRAIETG